jgi:hypothetical protein
MAQVLPPKTLDAGTLERGTETQAVKLAAVEWSVLGVFGKTHSLTSRDGQSAQHRE